ncbi:MAG: HAMP domain-containing histidine kinase [Treponema sp.]|jgi:signal transduction histidine kinase|nr:HAMP domain-containing histidine kinase [Treponema sp.]
MKRRFTISLQNRLTLTYALFTGLALAALTLTVNIAAGLVFSALAKENIAEKSAEIVRAVEDQYDPMSRSFDALTLQVMGIYFVHEGYLVTVEDSGGNSLWSARSCNMRQCMDVIRGITERMEGGFGIKGAMQTRRYPLEFAGRMVGNVIIETYGPFFYSETETRFLTAVNRLLLAAGAVITLLSAFISMILARDLAAPIRIAEQGARRIAQARGAGGGRAVRIPDRCRTRELAGLSRSINELAAELEEGERRQKQLTADIAHELRTPLTCLQGNIEAMIDGVYAPDAEHLESYREEILRLAKLIQDLGTLTSLEWDAIVLHQSEFRLEKLLEAVAEQFKPEARDKGITLSLEIPGGEAGPPITADYDRLKQVFINLLSNAVKYTDRGGVTITLAGGEVRVADTGMGIPAEDLPHIFERFYRSDKSRSRDSGGAGIGLSIAAAIVRAHGGTITAESGAESGGGGSVFRVRL